MRLGVGVAAVIEKGESEKLAGDPVGRIDAQRLLVALYGHLVLLCITLFGLQVIYKGVQKVQLRIAGRQLQRFIDGATGLRQLAALDELHGGSGLGQGFGFRLAARQQHELADHRRERWFGRRGPRRCRQAQGGGQRERGAVKAGGGKPGECHGERKWL